MSSVWGCKKRRRLSYSKIITKQKTKQMHSTPHPRQGLKQQKQPKECQWQLNANHKNKSPMKKKREKKKVLVLAGSGDSSVVRVPDSWSKGCGFESLLEWQENFLLQGQLSVLTLISVSIPPLCYRSSTKKIPVILPKVQVTAKHAYTLCMWLCMKWHGAWLYGVHKTCAETAAVSCGTRHVSAVSTPLRWIFRNWL